MIEVHDLDGFQHDWSARNSARYADGGVIETQRDDLTRRIAERRAAIQPGHDGTTEAAFDLQRHKHETPSSVIVIEALSRVLPDDTYLTELRANPEPA